MGPLSSINTTSLTATTVAPPSGAHATTSKPTSADLASTELSPTQKLAGSASTDKARLDQVHEEAKKLQALADSQQTSLKFSVDKDSQQVVVKVIDAATDKVITQIPSEEALYRSKQLDEVIGRLVSLKA